MKKHNFYAGPSVLNRGVIERTADAVLNFADMDLSLLEISHRSKQFQAVMPRGCRLLPLHLQQYHLRYRDPQGLRLQGTSRSRYE